MSLNNTDNEKAPAAPTLEALTDRAEISDSIEILGLEIGILMGLRRSPNPAKAGAAAKLEMIRRAEIDLLNRKLAAAA